MHLLARGNVWTSYVLRGSLQNACLGGDWRAGPQLQPIRNSCLSVAAVLRSRTNCLGISGNESYTPWVLSPPHSYADKNSLWKVLVLPAQYQMWTALKERRAMPRSPAVMSTPHNMLTLSFLLQRDGDIYLELFPRNIFRLGIVLCTFSHINNAVCFQQP